MPPPGIPRRLAVRLRTGPVRQAPDGARTLHEIADFGPNPGGLRMFAHVPRGLPKSSALVVILHGCGQTASGYDDGAGWSALGTRLGFAVLAPEQQNANNMGGCFNWFQPGDTARGVGEAASIHQMIAHMLGEYRLDARRVFITGLSAGGAMAAAMLAAYPEIFAGGAIIAGLAYGAASNVPEALNSMRHPPSRSAAQWGLAVRDASPHAGPWPRISVWHGDADATVHPDNAETLIGQWAHVHGVNADAPLVQETGHYRKRIWHGGDGKVVLEAYMLPGLAHGTPVRAGTDKQSWGKPGPFFLEAGLSSTLRIADFWGLPAVKLAAVKEAPVKSPLALAPPLPENPPRVVPPELVPAPLSEKGLRQMIVKALKAAGLLKDS